MPITERFKHIWIELKLHSPFALWAAGIVFMLIFKDISKENAYAVRRLSSAARRPSAMVTAALFAAPQGQQLLLILVIGYVGSIGVATLSDSILPY